MAIDGFQLAPWRHRSLIGATHGPDPTPTTALDGSLPTPSPSAAADRLFDTVVHRGSVARIVAWLSGTRNRCGCYGTRVIKPIPNGIFRFMKSWLTSSPAAPTTVFQRAELADRRRGRAGRDPGACARRTLSADYLAAVNTVRHRRRWPLLGRRRGSMLLTRRSPAACRVVGSGPTTDFLDYRMGPSACSRTPFQALASGTASCAISYRCSGTTPAPSALHGSRRARPCCATAAFRARRPWLTTRRSDWLMVAALRSDTRSSGSVGGGCCVAALAQELRRCRVIVGQRSAASVAGEVLHATDLAGLLTGGGSISWGRRQQPTLEVDVAAHVAIVELRCRPQRADNTS